MRQLFAETTSEAYLKALHHCLMVYDQKCSPRKMPVRECEDTLIQVAHPSSQPIQTRDPDRNQKISAYTAKEFELYERGATTGEEFGRAASYWRRIANPDGTVNSSYGHLIFYKKSCGNQKFCSELITPWEYAKRALTEDPDTRQAFLRFSLPEHQWPGNKDVVCTMHGYFRIRLNMLSLTIVMRSNDVVRGLVYDMPWFCSLLERMQRELPFKTYLGTYTHFAHSLHLYEEDLELAERMINGPEGAAKAA